MVERVPGEWLRSRRVMQSLAQSLPEEMAVTEGTYHDLHKVVLKGHVPPEPQGQA